MNDSFPQPIPRGSIKRWILFTLLFLVLAYGIYFVIDFLQPERMLVTIGKDTTVVTEPLTENGFPDYIRALNDHERQGVTPENNAFILLLNVVGPKEIPPEHEAEYFRQLGIAPLPREGKYFESYAAFVKNLPIEKLPAPNEKEKATPGDDDRIAEIRQRVLEMSPDHPWSKEEYPLVAEWLAANESILKRLDGIEQRPRYFDPVVPGDSPWLFSALLINISESREVTYALFYRANHAIKNGDRVAAWNDIQKIFRLADGLYDGNMLVTQLVGAALQNIAFHCQNSLVQDPAITPAELDAIAAHNKKLRGPDFAKALDLGERWGYLSAITMIAENGLDSVTATGKRVKSVIAPRASFYSRKRLDYDQMLVDANALYDQLVAVARIKDFDARNAKLQALDAQLAKPAQPGIVNSVKSFISKSERTKRVSDVLNALMYPAVTSMLRVGDKQGMVLEMHAAGIALARYRIKNGKYPVDFAELKSEGIAKLPLDVYSRKPCIYKATADDFVLYSIAHDGEDSGGFDGDDPRPQGGSHDDIAIYSLNRVPQPPVKLKESGDSDPQPDENRKDR